MQINVAIAKKAAREPPWPPCLDAPDMLPDPVDLFEERLHADLRRNDVAEG